MRGKKIAIIGAGISGLSAAAYAAHDGNEVFVFEKNNIPGGRARQFSTDNGYTFDMGPSWYWMPDVIEDFFTHFGKRSSDYYELINLNPQFEIVFEDGKIDVPSDYQELRNLFERIENGSAHKLDKFMQAAKFKYEVGMKEFVEKPCLKWSEFASTKILKSAFKLDLLTDFRQYVARYFKHPWLRSLMEFPVIFLGASPKNIPAMYSLMNYGGYVLGTWYPKGGFYQLILAMENIAKSAGVTFHYNSPVEKIVSDGLNIQGILVNGEIQYFDVIIASSDYQHSESLLDDKHKNYTDTYWKNKTFAPSCLIYYLGLEGLIPNLKHHTLFFENELDQHIDSIYAERKWPTEPLFYSCCPSKTDSQVAPKGHENIFLLMPLAIGIEDDEEIRERYFDEMIHRLEKHTGTTNLKERIKYKRSYCVSDFKKDYNAYEGNAYGLANTLSQTAFLKPSIKNKKIHNLYYTGQLTVPGPGVPPSIISGKIVAKEIQKLKNHNHEKAI